MKHLFVPYELAVLAKECGFNEDCLGWWHHPKGFNLQLVYTLKIKFHYEPYETPTPLYQQLVDWFREKHKILIEIRSDIIEVYYYVITPIVPFINNGRKTLIIKPVPYGEKDYEDYYKALNKALEEAFKLIKNDQKEINT